MAQLQSHTTATARDCKGIEGHEELKGMWDNPGKKTATTMKGALGSWGFLVGLGKTKITGLENGLGWKEP